MMDDRTRRLGQHTALTGPDWAVSALGPVPADPAPVGLATKAASDRRLPGNLRLRPLRRPDRSRTKLPDTRPASRLASGLRRPRSGWRRRRPGHAQRAAVAAPRQLHRRDSLGTRVCREGAAAVPARRLRRRPGAVRADAEAEAARKAGDQDCGAGRRTLAAYYRALRDRYQQRERTLAQAMADREEWDTQPSARRLAIAADAELRRRYPRQTIEPLRSGNQRLLAH